jgi:hypothetical protein
LTLKLYNYIYYWIGHSKLHNSQENSILFLVLEYGVWDSAVCLLIPKYGVHSGITRRDLQRDDNWKAISVVLSLQWGWHSNQCIYVLARILCSVLTQDYHIQSVQCYSNHCDFFKNHHIIFKHVRFIRSKYLDSIFWCSF